MMNNRELRIGNYLGGRNGIVTVSAIQEDGTVWLKEGGKNFIVDSDKPCLLQIPLTEEWLLRFGFTKVVYDSEETGYGTDYELEIYGVGFLSYSDDFSCALFSSKSNQKIEIGVLPNFNYIKTVHGLQNLYFALTNEELNYEQ